MTTHAQIAMVVLVSLIATACAGRNPYAIDDPVKLKRMSFVMAPGANGNRPARVELVRVADERLVAELIATDTSAWFGATGDAFKRAHPKAPYDAWELVPGHAAGPVNVKRKGKFAGILFCDAQSGSTPFRVQRDGHLTVVIDDTGCRLEGVARKKSIHRRWRRPKTVDVSFAMGSATNGNRPLRVELVRVDDRSLVSDLTRMSGTAWFRAGGRAFRREHPDVSVDDFELVPGRHHGPFRLAVNGKVNGVLFCGPSRNPPLELRWHRRIEVEVDGQGCRMSGTTRRVDNPLTRGERR